ncbi:hypothetical protein LTR62_004385 [Meristemomyces frigidus]|uniref:Beta-lactamase/transpeptidase-like protein n=1 Tax=Meristemomyces frigidus TaxID=1508187 RepID=A0AAN7TEU3_9PEZI|nr:hypothetical protein LTR62_004385 [Meristemomyces frigidus]
MSHSNPNIETILNAVPHLRRGPGGVIAVIKDGQVLGQRAWGYADLDQRIPMTTKTAFPICSISKQMVCLAMVSLLKTPTKAMQARREDTSKQFDAALRQLLPNLDTEKVRMQDLYNMQSGIRDYWAMTTLWGARPDDQFSLLHHADQALQRIKSFHFEPGTEYSYSNVNFHVLGRILENVSGMSLAQLLSERLFVPAGMTTAHLCPNTNGLPLPIVGYEGNETTGFFKAINRIEWAGDAGIAASLEDMIAYEKYLDHSLTEPGSLYAQSSKQQHFKNGTPAAYGYGLARADLAGRKSIAHGGALRGFRHERVQLPDERLSVVVMYNFETPPNIPVDYVVEKLLNWEEPKPEIFTAAKGWKGDYLDPETELSISITHGDREKPNTLGLSYGPGTHEELITLTSEHEANSDSMKAKLEGDTLHVERLVENRTIKASRITPLTETEKAQISSADYTGRYFCEESDSTFTISGDQGTLYGAFDGFLGRGPIWLMRPLGKDVWSLGNPRGLDSTPPGDWTVVFKRGGGGVEGATLGCWLARKVKYVRS